MFAEWKRPKLNHISIDNLLKCKFFCIVTCKNCGLTHRVWNLEYDDITHADCSECGEEMIVKNQLHFC